MRRHLLLATLAALGAISAFTTPAAAQCDGCVVNAIQNLRSDVRDTTRAVDEANMAIVDAITRSTQQLSGYETRSAQSQRRVEEAAQLNNTIRQRQIARAEAEGGRYDPAASACVDLSGILQFGGGQGAQGLGGNDIVNVSRNRSNGNGGEGGPTAIGGLAVAQEIKTARDELSGVGGYLDPTSDLRLLTEAATMDTTDQDVARAYTHLINNIVDPTPARPVTEGEADTPAGLAQIAAHQIDQARRSASHAIFAHLGDLAAPTGSEELADWAKRAVTESYPNQVGDVVSNQQVIDIFVHSRFANPEWHQELAQMSPEAVNREIALTNALNLHVNWMRFQLERRVAAATATHLAVELDNRDATSTAMPASFEGSGGGS